MARPPIGVLVVRGVVVVAAGAMVVTAALTSWPLLAPAPSADDRRLADLQRLSHAFTAYHADHGAIPATLARLPPDPAVPIHTKDPVTHQPYDYRPLGPLAYELCARFDAPSAGERRDFWWHDAGRQCFSLELKARPRPVTAPTPTASEPPAAAPTPESDAPPPGPPPDADGSAAPATPQGPPATPHKPPPAAPAMPPAPQGAGAAP